MLLFERWPRALPPNFPCLSPTKQMVVWGLTPQPVRGAEPPPSFACQTQRG